MAVAVVALPAAAMAHRAAGNFSPSLAYTALVTKGGKATETLDFAIAAYVGWDGGDAATIQVRVTLPAGVRWSGPAPGAADGCTSSATGAACTKAVVPTPGTNLAAAFPAWRVVAERRGSYTFEVAVGLTGDPDPSDDTSSMTVEVGSASAAVALKPRPTRAGTTVVASHPVYLTSADQTQPLAVGAVRCAVKIGPKIVPAKGSLNAGRSTCAVRDAGERQRESPLRNDPNNLGQARPRQEVQRQAPLTTPR